MYLRIAIADDGCGMVKPMTGFEAIRNLRVLVTAVGLLLVFLVGWAAWQLYFSTPSPTEFSGQLAYQHVTAQMDFGPRITGSEASRAAGGHGAGPPHPAAAGGE